jgi:UDP-N-acetylglucosamine acyltransferase
MAIHQTALIHPEAEIGSDPEIGPGVVIGPGVRVGDRCRIGPYSVLQGPLVMGDDCILGMSVAMGADPQLKIKRSAYGSTRIGNRVEFREFSQVHRSMYAEGETVVDDDGYFMAGAHIGHDCVIGKDVIMANNALLAGHVQVGWRAFISGSGVVHQFSRLGDVSMVAGLSAVEKDVPPYCTVVGQRPCRVSGLNVIGLRRAGIEASSRTELRQAYRALFRTDLPLTERIAQVSGQCAEVQNLIRFLGETKRGVIGYGGRSGKASR